MSSMETLTAEEKASVAMHRWAHFMFEMTFGICAATRLTKMMRLCVEAA